MASRPKLKELCAAIEDDGGEQHIFDQVVAGTKIREIMEPYGITRGMFYWWVKDGGEERAEGYRLAKEFSAEAHAEMAGTILEELAVDDDGRRRSFDSADVSLAGKRSDYHRWLARVRDRTQFGEDKGAAVNLNLNLSLQDAHLGALKELGRMTRLQPSPEVIPEAEFEELAPVESSAPALSDLFEDTGDGI